MTNRIQPLIEGHPSLPTHKKHVDISFDPQCEWPPHAEGRRVRIERSANSVSAKFYLPLSPLEAKDRIEHNLRIAALEREVRELKERVQKLETEKAAARPNATDRFDPGIAEVVAITSELFGTAQVDIDRDPEEPDSVFVVFSVKSKGDISELVEKRITWHEKIRNTQHLYSGMLRLSIAPE